MKIRIYMFMCLACLLMGACKTPQGVATQSVAQTTLPLSTNDSLRQTVQLPWREFFKDADLACLIDTALKNNQDLKITVQELAVARSGILFQQGQLLPSVSAGMSIGANKVGRYTSEGAGNVGTMLTDKHVIPDVMTDFHPGVQLDWDVDIWSKLSAQKKSAVENYLATEEGRRMVTAQLIADVAENYYQLLALDNKLDLIHRYIALQKKAVAVAQIQKEADADTQLAVEKFKAELAKASSNEFSLRQEIVERENAINLLLGRYPCAVHRDKGKWYGLNLPQIAKVVPAKLLLNRPDVMQAEHQLKATNWDVEAARKEFLPSLNISADLGLDAFNPKYLLDLPKSLAFGIVGGLTAPLINKKAIEANYQKATALQLEALYNYDKTLLSAYSETCTQLAKIQNLNRYFSLKEEENMSLQKSVEVARQLYMNNRATYLDVLDSERDALDAQMDLIDTRLSQLSTLVEIYKGLM